MSLQEDIKRLRDADGNEIEADLQDTVLRVCDALDRAQTEIRILKDSLVTYLFLQDIHGRTGKTAPGYKDAHMDLFISAQSAAALLQEWGIK